MWLNLPVSHVLVSWDSCAVTSLLACALLHTRGLFLHLARCAGLLAHVLVCKAPAESCALIALLTGPCRFGQAMLDKRYAWFCLASPSSNPASAAEPGVPVRRRPT